MFPGGTSVPPGSSRFFFLIIPWRNGFFSRDAEAVHGIKIHFAPGILPVASPKKLKVQCDADEADALRKYRYMQKV